MTLVTLLSTCAMALGLGGIVPQLIRMARSRSAAGQAPLGWAMGLAANVALAYVNAVGFGALLLTASNILAGTLCAAALALVCVLGRRPAPVVGLEQLATQELVILRDAISAERARR